MQQKSKTEATTEKTWKEHDMKYETAEHTTKERKMQIEQFAKETGLSFVDAKKMLKEIESEDASFCEIMREMWY